MKAAESSVEEEQTPLVLRSSDHKEDGKLRPSSVIYIIYYVCHATLKLTFWVLISHARKGRTTQ